MRHYSTEHSFLLSKIKAASELESMQQEYEKLQDESVWSLYIMYLWAPGSYNLFITQYSIHCHRNRIIIESKNIIYICILYTVNTR